MKRHLFIILVILGHLLSASGADTFPYPNFVCENSNASEKSRISEKMGQLRSSLLERDSVMLSKLLSDDLTYGHTNGWIQSKEELIRSVVDGQQEYSSITVKGMTVRVYGTTAIVNLDGNASLKFDGKPLELDMKVLLVWVLLDGEWKLVARQSVRNT